MGLTGTPAMASPVQVIECQVLLPVGPLPIDSLDLKYTIRRHHVEVEPYELTETSLWNQAKFTDAGTAEIDIYPLEGPVRTEMATGLDTVILDGGGVIRDELEDTATGSTERWSYEGFVIEEWKTILIRNDGTAIDTHLLYPEEFDPANFNTATCDVTWRVPNGGVVCQVPGGGSTICKTGVYRGRIQSVSYQEHEAPHGESFQINAGLNDAWVNEDAPFQGMFITVYPRLGIIFVAWFTFDSVQPSVDIIPVFGANDTRWVTAVGSFDGHTAQLRAELTSGGIFNGSDPLPSQDTNYGTMDLHFSDCNNATVTFNFPSAGESGEFAISRVLAENASLCEALIAE